MHANTSKEVKMQVQRINNAPAFHANKVSVMTRQFKDSEKYVLNTYLLNENDKPFLEKLLRFIKKINLPTDKKAIGQGESSEIVERSLKEALSQNNATLLTIDNQQNIKGIINFEDKGENLYVKNVFVADEKSQIEALIRKALFLPAMKHSKDSGKSLTVKPDDMTLESIQYYLNTFGLSAKLNKLGVFELDNPRVEKKINSITNTLTKTDVNLQPDYNNVDLEKVLLVTA